MSAAGSTGPDARAGNYRRLFLVADDLTGALDAAAQFASPRAPVDVRWTAPASVPGFGLALDSGTREVSPEAARAAVAACLARLPERDDTLFYAKLDSLLRGNAAVEIAVWLKALTPDRCIIAPAFPFQNRVTVGARQYRLVDGQRQPLACDLAADLEALGLKVARCRPGDAAPPGVSIWDAASDADLAAIASAGRAGGGTVLWCGSGGLAGALSPVLAGAARNQAGALAPLARPLVGFFGTDHEVTAGQIAACGDHALAVTDGGDADLRRIAAAMSTRGAALVRVDLPAGLQRADAAIRIGLVFAALAAELKAPATLLVAGGETLRALCQALDADGLRLDGQIVPGVATSRMVGGRFDGTRVVSKSGAFGAPDLLRRLVVQ